MAVPTSNTSAVPTTLSPIPTAQPTTTTAVPVPTATIPSVVPTTTGLPSPTSNPYPISPDPAQPTTTSKGGGGKPTTTRKGTGASTTSSGPAPTTTPENGGDNSGGDKSSKPSVLAPVIGSIAAVLVLAFIVGVFVMRYKKKSRARKRRLEFLEDHTGTGTTTALGGAGAGAGAAAAAASSQHPTSAQNTGRPSTSGGTRPLEMAAVGGGAVAANQLHNEGYDYQQGYQQVPYGGYQDQYDQYDPYYAQRQQQAQGYYADQQQGYYPEQQQAYQNQFGPPIPLHNGGQGTGSPSMTHATASPKSYPQPPPSTTTGGYSSPRTPQQSAVPVPVPGDGHLYDRNAKVESEYAGAHSAGRNPQLVPENEDRIKVPL
ncbi:hypothetical protein BC939DRAFT_509002 [Gamsiella multidivaricata]|uniref:uncharacterized protein n=1 Tax=Gamsiella multidivaricata TaxID=101098 RepID=UPI002220547C|nr:uncharacterized protein BC939DRAFT_509002 [Gamsiella multidivaricata]KAG0354282.1 hypothetical protein BGZ54_001713 [Gamsiella multidivaricata]KAI7815741.1 hypothetical protein BC939DRAFT_509002 [Gamsiella multidivaricata]